MSTQDCAFFGGPAHGQELPIDDKVNTVDIAVIAAPEVSPHLVELPDTFPVARYTRVHYPKRTPTAQFEYVGRATT